MIKRLKAVYKNEASIPSDYESLVLYSEGSIKLSCAYSKEVGGFITSVNDILLSPRGATQEALQSAENKEKFRKIWEEFINNNYSCSAVISKPLEILRKYSFYIFTSKGIKRKEIFLSNKFRGYGNILEPSSYPHEYLSKYKSFYCEDCKEYKDIDNLFYSSLYLTSQKLLCRSCYDKQFYTCSSCGKSFDKNKFTPFMFEDEPMCSHCSARHITSCSCCGNTIRKDRNKATDEGFICNSCYKLNYEECTRCKVAVKKGRASYYEPTNQVLCNRCKDFYDKARDIVVLDNKYNNCLTKLSYGIELETSSGDVNRLYSDSNINYLFRPTSDASITGAEWVSPILRGDDGFEYIKSFLASLNRNTTVDSNCGYHVHFGVTFNSISTLYKILYGYRMLQDFFFNLVPESRLEPNKRTGKCYCAKLPHNLEKFGEDSLNKLLYDTADKIVTQSDKMNKYGNSKKGRYYWLNMHSYFYRRTLEIRNHEGTLDYSDITNWINLHGRVIEYFTNTGFISLTKKIKSINSMESFFNFLEEILNKDIRIFYEKKYNVLYNKDKSDKILYDYYMSKERSVTTKDISINKKVIYKYFYDIEQLLYNKNITDTQARIVRRVSDGGLIRRNYSYPTLDSWVKGIQQDTAQQASTIDMEEELTHGVEVREPYVNNGGTPLHVNENALQQASGIYNSALNYHLHDTLRYTSYDSQLLGSSIHVTNINE